MNRIAMTAAGIFALTAAFSTAAHAQCWWTGFNYGCSEPVVFVPTYVPAFWYGYGYQPWWRFGYDTLGY